MDQIITARVMVAANSDENWLFVNHLVPNTDHSQHTVCDLKWPSQLKSSSITQTVIAANEIPTFSRVPWAFYGAHKS